MSQPTDQERARWWRDGWGRKYNYAIDADRMTVRIERREWRAVIRLARARNLMLRKNAEAQKGRT